MYDISGDNIDVDISGGNIDVDISGDNILTISVVIIFFISMVEKFMT